MTQNLNTFNIEDLAARARTDESNISSSDGKIINFMRENTQTCRASCINFKKQLEDKLFKEERERVSWKKLYYTIKSFGIFASKTTIWNLFLDTNRRVLTEAEDLNPQLEKRSETFIKSDITEERANFLFYMTESYNKWKRKRVRRWNREMMEELLMQKFLKGKGFNLLFSLLITIFAILLYTVAVFPMGEGIFDTTVLCIIVMVTYGIGCLWYLFSLLGERWYPSTYGGLALNSIFMVASLVMSVLFFHYASGPAYYDDRGCYNCPVCEDTDDKLCYEYNKFSESINNRWSEVNTCSCALVERLRISEPIIPYGQSAEYCGGSEGDDCSCDAILAASDEHWDESDYTCVYFDYHGTMFFYFGLIVGILMMIDFILSFLSFTYWLMLWLGCGRGPFSNCVCCGIDFDLEQRRAEAKLKRCQ